LQLVGTTGTQDGTVSFVSPRVDPATGGLQVKIAPDAGLKAPVGLTVTANIIIEDRPLALTIPRSAMVAGPAVFVLVAGHAVKTAVEVIEWPAARLIVTKGLSVGDAVIVTAAGLTDGQAVKVGP
jgi:multidrug efflux pump subunit AcrA (membrane-fusion protein)